MADPMSDERLADRRKKIKAEHVERRYFYGAECSCGECLPCVVLADELAWLDGVERLRVELAAFVPPGTLGAGETPALCGTCKDRLCVPGLPGCARCVKAELAETTHALTVTGEKVTALRKQRDTAEAERDAAREQVKRVRLCWKSARRGRAMARAELATWQAAGRTTDLEGDVGDHLSDLADWETENATAPEWLVKAVVDLLAPIAAERDRLTRERDGLARADKAGQRWASGRIDALEEKVHRVRQVHVPQCGGGCAAVSCECGPDDLVCAECETPAPCATIRALGGTEPGR